MSITYNITTNFTAKDSLPSNDPDKVVRGSEFATEFNAIQTAFNLAAPSAAPTFTGTATFADLISDSLTTGAVIGTTGTFNTSVLTPEMNVSDGATGVLDIYWNTGDVRVDAVDTGVYQNVTFRGDSFNFQTDTSTPTDALVINTDGSLTLTETSSPDADPRLLQVDSSGNVTTTSSTSEALPAGSVDGALLRWDLGNSEWKETDVLISSDTELFIDSLKPTGITRPLQVSSATGKLEIDNTKTSVDEGSVNHSTLRWDSLNKDWVESDVLSATLKSVGINSTTDTFSPLVIESQNADHATGACIAGSNNTNSAGFNIYACSAYWGATPAVDACFLHSTGGNLAIGAPATKDLLFTNGTAPIDLEEMGRFNSDGYLGINVADTAADLDNFLTIEGDLTNTTNLQKWAGALIDARYMQLGVDADLGTSGSTFYFDSVGPGNSAIQWRINGVSVLTGVATQVRLPQLAGSLVDLQVGTTGILSRATSDKRLKKEIVNTPYGLDDVNQLRSVMYRYKDAEVYGEEAHLGFIAQEVREIVPEVVGEGEDGILSINYTQTIPILVNAIKELTTRLEALENV